MARKTADTKTHIEYVSVPYRIEALRIQGSIAIRHGSAGMPSMTLDQLDKFADKLKQLVQDAREAV